MREERGEKRKYKLEEGERMQERRMKREEDRRGNRKGE